MRDPQRPATTESHRRRPAATDRAGASASLLLYYAAKCVMILPSEARSFVGHVLQQEYMMHESRHTEHAQEQPVLIDAAKTAMMLSISPRTLWTMTNDGEVPHVRIGRRVLYPLEGLRRFVEASTQGGAA